MNKNYCVYLHRNKINNKVYIGITNDIKRRWRSNGIEYKPRGKNSNPNGRPFWNAIQKYGWDNFEHIILFDNLSKEDAEDLEIKLIKEYNSRDKNFGYNVAEGGNGGHIYKEHPKGMKGKHHTEEKKIKQRELMKKLNEEGKCGANWKNGHPRGMKGKHHTEEAKEKISRYQQENNPTRKKILVIMPNGERKIYPSVISVQKELKISNWITSKLLKSGKPYKVSKNVTSDNREYLLTLEGLVMQYLQ